MAVSPLRFSGMASGLDTDNLIKQLMQTERAPLNKLFQNKQILQWRQTDYRDLNNKVLALKNNAFNMKLQTTYRQYTSASSNDSIVSASATSTASPTSYIFNEISALAKSSSIATADGQNISRETTVVTGGEIKIPINTDNNNTFKINYNNGGFVNVTLDAGKVYNGTTPGGTVKDLANDLQSKIDTALSAQGVAAGTVKVSLNKNNYIQITANEFPASTTPKSLVLQEGDSNDLLKASLGFTTDAATKQVTGLASKIDFNESIYTNILQHRFKNTEDFSWVVNGSDSQTLGPASDNIISTVDYNATNLNNYIVTSTESKLETIASAADNIVTTMEFNPSNWANISVNVNGTKYTGVMGKQQSDLKENEVLIGKDDNGKIKLTFKSQLNVNDKVQIDNTTRYSVVTGKAKADLGVGEALLENDGTGKAKFTFKNTLDTNTKISVDRHDFEFSTMVYNQDGSTSNTTFNVNAYTETMNSLLNRISTSSTAGLSAFYDSGTDKLVLNSKKTGNNNTAGADISLSGNFLNNALGLTKYTEGSDAAFTVNGLATTRKDNSFTINGVTFNLKGTMTAGTPVNVTVSQDVQKVYDTIKSFVDKYNETIEAVNGKLNEKKYRDFTPLTDEQKDSMKEDDIKKWEEKAKSGLLAGDTILSRITGGMRTSLNDKVEGVTDTNYTQLYQIGITTSNIYQERGKLMIDEAKLKKAITDAPDKVMELFTKSSTSADKNQAYRESGLATRIYNEAVNGIKSITDKAGATNSFSLFDNSLVGKEISDIDKRISTLENRMIDRENSYYKRFAALESAMSKMNSQSSWLSQQLGGAK